MNELKPLLDHVFNCYKRVELIQAYVKDKAAYEASMRDKNTVLITEKDGYSYDRLAWCFVTERNEQCSRLTTCRDYFNESLQASINDGSHSYYPPGWFKRIPIDRLRILFVNVTNIARLKNAIKTLDIYAKEAGWQLAKVKNVDTTSRLHKKAMLVKADQNWMRYPQLLSMFMLIIRFTHATGEIRPADIKDINSVHKFWEDILDKKIRTFGSRDLPGNYSWLYHVYRFFPTIICKENKIFDKEMPKAWQGEKFHGNSGIHTFVERKCPTDHMKEAKKLIELYAEVEKNEQEGSKMHDRN